MLSSRKTSTVVGLDVEAGSIAATEVTSNGGVRLGNTGIAPLGPGVTREGEVADADELAALRRAGAIGERMGGQDGHGA